MKFEFTFAKGPGINPPTPETPFRILVLGDLDGRTSRNLTQPLADRRPVPVDLDAFEPFLKSLRAEVQLGFSDPATAPIRLAAGGLEDLHPDRLFEQMDLFAALRGLRRRLLEPATFAAAAAEVRAWGGAGTPPRPARLRPRCRPPANQTPARSNGSSDRPRRPRRRPSTWPAG
jgi:type VI secretion system ImpB/VipA family protein